MPGKKNKTWMLEPDDLDKVGYIASCPRCHEMGVDYLEWDAEGESVTCSTCHYVYNPEHTSRIYPTN